MKMKIKAGILLLVLVALVTVLMLFGMNRGKPIEGAVVSESTMRFIKHHDVVVKPIVDFKQKQHPFLAKQDLGTIHADSYNSDVHQASGPVGNDIQVRSRRGSNAPGGMCTTVTFTSKGNIIVVCRSLGGVEINLLESRTMKLLAKYGLPMSSFIFEGMLKFDVGILMKDTSRTYFYLDNKDRVVIADGVQHILRLGHRENEKGEWEFYIDEEWDVSEYVSHDCFAWNNWFPGGNCDHIVSVRPDYNGLIWWVTLYGKVGTVNPESGGVKTFNLDGEEIQNSFAVAYDGVFILTDHALYSFAASSNGTPVIKWRQEYDRSDERKAGAASQGSGTTPTLLDSKYVVIADNADPQANVLVINRYDAVEEDRIICKVPVFTPGESVIETSMIVWGKSIIAKNDSGYLSALQQKRWNTMRGGMVRIDIRDDDSGCDIAWQSGEVMPSVVPKLSVANGIVYSYSFKIQDNGEIAWYVVAIDSENGKTLFKALTGAGPAYDANRAPMAIGPDGTLYTGSLEGLISIWDKN